MTTISEADVIRIIKDNPRLVFDAMREDPELLKEVRQAILTDDILELPRQLARMSDTLETLVGVVSTLNDRVGSLEASAERTDARLDRIESHAERTDARLDRIESHAERTDARLDRIESHAERTDTRLDRIESYAEQTDARLDRIEAKVERIGPLETRVGHLESLVGHLVGSELERKLGTTVPNRLEAVYEVDDIHILVYQDRHPAVDRDFLRMIDDARRNAVIDGAQHRRLRSADMVVRANRGDDEVFFTVEASSTVAEDDIDRTIRSALALEKVVEAEVVPVVTGYAIPNDVREYNAGEKSGRARIFEMRRRNR